MTSKIQDAVSRITEMENCFDILQETLHSAPKQIFENPTIKSIYEKLVGYYESEDWINDYQSDELGILPQDLKRGVLSEDGIYNLIFEINEFLESKDI